MRHEGEGEHDRPDDSRLARGRAVQALTFTLTFAGPAWATSVAERRDPKTTENQVGDVRRCHNATNTEGRSSRKDERHTASAFAAYDFGLARLHLEPSTPSIT